MRILILSAHFPHLDQPGLTYATPFLSVYAAEWVKAGHQVTVIHYERKYPVLFYCFARAFRLIGIHRFEKYVVDRSAYTETEYSYDGYSVHRFLYNKYIPHSVTNIRNLKVCISKTQAIIDSFNYDVIIGDCLDPVITIINNMKFKKACIVSQIVHAADFAYLSKSVIKNNCDIIDTWLIRSEVQRKPLENVVGNKKIITMFSGISYDQIMSKPVFRIELKKLLYVGALYKSKGVDTILDALASTNSDHILKIVGKGPDEVYFKQRVKQLGIENRVVFVGPVPHSDVFSYMQEADGLVLISHETFGMVYIEAMSQACIPIGTYDEGIDGVVKNGINGFLVHLGNSRELAALLISNDVSDSNNMRSISMNAYKTAKNMTNQKLAISLLRELAAGENI